MSKLKKEDINKDGKIGLVYFASEPSLNINRCRLQGVGQLLPQTYQGREGSLPRLPSVAVPTPVLLSPTSPHNTSLLSSPGQVKCLYKDLVT